MIYYSIVRCYEHTNLIRDNVCLSSLISLTNGFVLETNIYGCQFSNELEMKIPYQMSNKANTVALANPPFFGTPSMLIGQMSLC